jgi:ribosome-associated toxin RatA of RatAB toxin-antitoxin module
MTLSINRSALVMHSSARMHALVNDIASYPEFLPWCSKALILEKESGFMLASLEVSKGRMKQSFTTRNDLSADGRILMSLVEGPFSHLKGVWDFTVLQDNACKVALNLEFELKRSITKVAFGAIFNQAANTMVDAFCARADQVYG